MELMVKANSRLANRVIELELVDADGNLLPAWTPGGHIDLVLADGLVRQYSLCSDPSDLSCYRIAVLLQEEGRGGSRWIHQSLHDGDVVQVRGPKNHFALEPAPRYLFIAGGIGITPLIPMMDHAARRGTPFRLMYGGRTRAAMAYWERLKAYGDSVTLVPEDTGGMLDLDSILAEPQRGTLIYCCGPEPLLRAVEQRCASWPDGSLHFERFAAVEGAPPVVARTGDQSFEVYLRRSGLTIQVAATESLLDALEQHGAGAGVLSDCREGICGTCEVQVVGGAIDHRDGVLSDKERQRGDTMMVCVSRATSPRLVLDL